MLKVVQCWDDGVDDDIRLIQILKKYGAKASFNLNPATHGTCRKGGYHDQLKKTIYRLARSELNEIYEGFTIANHSMSHPWPTRISLEDWRAEVADARKILQDWFQQPILGFVYPFGDYNEATANVVREAGHLYGRVTQNATPCLPVDDPMIFKPDCRFHGENFWELYDQAKASEAEVFYFWGHSFEICTEADWSAFDAKIARIAQDPDSEWAELTDLFV
jgi:peptidoglycan/xylan/chitin deacetylase (PgdA/CDA1 family)